jgi:hypothetical protein
MRPLRHWLKTRVPRRAWASGRLRLKVTQNCVTALEPWKAVNWYQTGVNLGVISKLKVVSTDASNSGWGALYEGRPTFGLWSSQEKSLHINCLEMKAVENALRFFLPLLKGHRPCPHGQHVSGFLHKSPGRSEITKPSCTGKTPPCMGSTQPTLAESDACASTSECGSRQAVQGQRSPRGMVPPSSDSSAVVGHLWHSGSRPLCVSRQRSVSNMLHKEQGCAGPSLAQPPSLCFPSDHAVTTGNQVYQGERFLCASSSSVLAEPSLFPELMQLQSLAPWPVPLRRDLLSQAGGTIWHPRPELWALHVWAINGYPSVSPTEC